MLVKTVLKSFDSKFIVTEGGQANASQVLNGKEKIRK